MQVRSPWLWPGAQTVAWALLKLARLLRPTP